MNVRETIAAGLITFLAACAGNTVTQPTGQVSLHYNYSLTFTADNACASLPANVQSRTYSASSRDGLFPLFTLAGIFESFESSGPLNIILLAVRTDSAEAWFEDGPIFERVTPDGTLMIYGRAAGPISGSKIELPFSGSFLYCAKTNGAGNRCSVPEVNCRSTNHKLTVVPQ